MGFEMKREEKRHTFKEKFGRTVRQKMKVGQKNKVCLWCRKLQVSNRSLEK